MFIFLFVFIGGLALLFWLVAYATKKDNIAKQNALLAYTNALTNLKTDGSPDSRQKALILGRRHYALYRPNKLLTVYDETRISNDIMAHTKMN